MGPLSGKASIGRQHTGLDGAAPVRTARIDVGGVEILERISDDALRLCEEAGVSEPTTRLEWNEAYLRAFSPKGKLVLVSVWEDDRLRAVLPLFLSVGFMSGLPVRKLTCCANIHSCRVDLICCRGEERADVLRAMWREIQRFKQWDVLELPYALEGCGLDELLRIAEEEGHSLARKFAWRALYFQIQTPSEEPNWWLAGTSRKFRANLRRTRKQVEELGSVSFQHYTFADPSALERFFELEASGWKGREGTAIACRPDTRLFYELVATAATHQKYFSLDFLELDGKAISAHFALIWNGRYILLKAAYDEQYRRLGPGHLIVDELLKHLGPTGLKEFDFVGPAAYDEECWASEGRNSYTWFVFPRSMYGALLYFVRISGRRMIKSVLRRFARRNSTGSSK